MINNLENCSIHCQNYFSNRLIAQYRLLHHLYSKIMLTICYALIRGNERVITAGKINEAKLVQECPIFWC